MEFDNAIFQHLESFGKQKLLKMAMENSKSILKWM